MSLRKFVSHLYWKETVTKHNIIQLQIYTLLLVRYLNRHNTGIKNPIGLTQGTRTCSIFVQQTYGSKNLPKSCPITVYTIGFPIGQTHRSGLQDTPKGKLIV